MYEKYKERRGEEGDSILSVYRQIIYQVTVSIHLLCAREAHSVLIVCSSSGWDVWVCTPVQSSCH